jgi:tetratricopeptide (TPR) repeat protein
MRSGRTSLAALLFLGLFTGKSALAQPDESAVSTAKETSAEVRAFELFKQSDVEYRAGRFRQAARLLEESYRLSPEPVLLYNLAKAYEGLGEFERALATYDRYLKAEHDVKDRGAIEQRMNVLRRTIEERRALDKARKERDRPRPERAPRPERKPSAVPWVIAGAGAIGLVVGGVLFAQARSRRDDAASERDATRAATIDAEAQDLNFAANITLGAGAVVLLAGGTWGVVDIATAGRDTRQGATGIAFAGRF